MNDPVGCGYFFDGMNGLIGSGQFAGGTGAVPGYNLRIWRTSNGGLNWIQCQTPNGQGRVTSIFMKDNLVGYASIYSDNYSLWKTLDGGKTWFDITNGQDGPSVCVHATSKALIKTMWTNFGAANSGGFSTNDGQTFNNTFYQQFGRENINGIAFIDDLNGVVMAGHLPNNFSNEIPYCYYTNDGGISWKWGADVDESWGVYAEKTSNTFYALPEGFANAHTTTVRSSTDVGRTWNILYDFGNTEFTGHIAGKAGILYVQSVFDGLYRSDNGGKTWKNVGGFPSNGRDTRFVVTGCHGEVVYAFDNQGGVWKTTDGGDGTLQTAPEPYIGSIASVPAGDTVSIPIYLKATEDTFSISKFTLHLSYNTDILSCVNYDVLNTLASPIKKVYFTNDKHGVSLTCEMQNTITRASDLSKPLIRLVMQSYLSSELSTMVRLDTLSVGSQPPQPLCSIPQQLFEIQYECGDSMLAHFMKDSSIAKILSITPNPIGEGNDLSIGVYLPTQTLAYIDIVDMKSAIILSTSENTFVRGSHTITVNARSLPTGAYIARLHADNSVVIPQKFLVWK